MANNPTVTLTFAGDSRQVTRAADQAGSATDELRDKIDKNSVAMARDTQRSATETARSLGSQRREYDRTAESFEDMVRRLARARRQATSLERDKQLVGLPNLIDQRASQQAGEESGSGVLRGFGQRVSSGLKGVGSGPLIAGALASLPSLFGPVGLAAGGALVLGFGAGIAGIGLATAAKMPEVAAHFERLKVNVQAKLMQISVPFKQTLIDIAADAQTAFNAFVPELQKSFPQAAKDISEFSHNITEGFRQLAPVIGPIMDAFGKILDELGPELPGVFQNIANALIPLAETVGENADGFAKMVVFILNIIPAAINLITAMIEFGAWWGQVWRGAGEAVSSAASSIMEWLRQVGAFAGGIADFVGGVLGRMRDAMVQRFKEMLQGVRDFPGTLKAVIGDTGRILWDAGWRLIGGLLDGIKARFAEVRGLLANLTGMLPNWKGPAEVDARLLTANGRLIIGSLVDGFRREEPSVQGYLEDLTRFIGGFGPDAGSLAATPTPAPRRGGRDVVRLGSDGTRVGDALLELVQEAIRGRGGDPSVLGV